MGARTKKSHQAPHKWNVQSQGPDYAPLHPSTRTWEIPRNSVTIEKVIGKGAFGQVAKGTAIDLRERPGKSAVAVKMLKGNPKVTSVDGNVSMFGGINVGLNSLQFLILT